MDRDVVVDADVLIDYFAGVEPSAGRVAELLESGRLAVTAVTVFELACGVATEGQRRDLEHLLAAVSALPLDSAAALRSAAVYRELREKGQLIGALDLLVAGTCLARSLPLLSRNLAEFGRVAGLAVMSP